MLHLEYIVNTVFTSRTYILKEDESGYAWIVDCGDVEGIINAIGNKSVKGVLLTHVHYDHIYGLPLLTELFPDVRVYTTEAGRKALIDPRLNMSKYHDDSIIYDASKNIIICKEGDSVDLFSGISAKVYETPGHNPSCLTFEVADYLFTGDSYIPGIKVVTTLPGGNKTLAAESVDRILKLAEGKVVCAGHEV